MAVKQILPYGNDNLTSFSFLKQPGLLLELISLPQSQAVKLLHCHTKHLSKLLGRKMTLKKQGQRESP